MPATLWTVIAVLPAGSDEVNGINSPMRVMAVWMPNTSAVGAQSWGNYRVSVNPIDQQTGYDLLLNVSQSVQRVIERKADSAIL